MPTIIRQIWDRVSSKFTAAAKVPSEDVPKTPLTRQQVAAALDILRKQLAEIGFKPPVRLRYSEFLSHFNSHWRYDPAKDKRPPVSVTSSGWILLKPERPNAIGSVPANIVILVAIPSNSAEVRLEDVKLLRAIKYPGEDDLHNKSRTNLGVLLSNPRHPDARPIVRQLPEFDPGLILKTLMTPAEHPARRRNAVRATNQKEFQITAGD